MPEIQSLEPVSLRKLDLRLEEVPVEVNAAGRSDGASA